MKITIETKIKRDLGFGGILELLDQASSEAIDLPVVVS